MANKHELELGLTEAELEAYRVKENRKVAREASWLTDIFQEHGVSVTERQEVLRRAFRKSEEERKK